MLLTRNLKLRLSDTLSADSRYNLQRIDALGGLFRTDATLNNLVQSQQDIYLLPNSADIGGSGDGGTIFLGTADQPLTSLEVNTLSAVFLSGLSLADEADTDFNLSLLYQSTLSGAVDTASRTLTLDVEGADRSLILGGSFSIDQDVTFTASGSVTLTLPQTGTVVTEAGTSTLSNKTIAAGANSLSGIADANIDAAAAIEGSKINPDFGVQTVFTTGGYSSFNGVAFSFPAADGTTGQLLATDGAGQLTFATALTANLPDQYLRIGGAGNVEFQVDTAAVGQILADSINGLTVKSGSIDTDEIAEGTNLYFTDERAQDAVGTVVANTASVQLTYTDLTPAITADVLPGGVDHDQLLNFVADEHVAHTAVSVTAGADSGLTAANNDLSANIGLSVDIAGTTEIADVAADDYLIAEDTSETAKRKVSIADLQAAIVPASFKTNWTHLDGATKVVTHSLNTTDIRVETYDVATGATFFSGDVIRTDVNTLTLSGENLPATFDYRILITVVPN